MQSTHKSSSIEQMSAEEYVFSVIQKELCVGLEKNPKINVAGKTYIQPDFYSEENRIIGEIFAHIGSLKVGQKHKIAHDILKMLLLEKATGETFRKMIVVCDKEVHRALRGYSALAESFTQFGVELRCVELDEGRRREVLAAQKRQVMVNN